MLEPIYSKTKVPKRDLSKDLQSKKLQEINM